jgi:hypothetical protein
VISKGSIQLHHEHDSGVWRERMCRLEPAAMIFRIEHAESGPQFIEKAQQKVALHKNEVLNARKLVTKMERFGPQVARDHVLKP